MARYQRLIFSVPLRYGLSEEDAADVFQGAWLRLYERLETLREPSRVGFWLASTARRLSLDRISTRPPLVGDGDEALNALVADEATPDQALEQMEEQQRIRNAVESLSGRCRDLLLHLFYDEDQPSYSEVALRMAMPMGSIGPIRRRCFERLRRLL